MAEKHPVGSDTQQTQKLEKSSDAPETSFVDSTASEATQLGVVGLGYVGLPLALATHDAGYEVIGVDVDDTVVDQLRGGESTVTDVSSSEVQDAVEDDVEFTTDYTALSDADGVCICVPTPLRKTNTPDLSYVTEAAERLAPVVPEGCTVVLESTVYPGATEEVLAEEFEKNGLEVGEDIFLAFSPERIDPGNEQYEPTEIPKVLGGVTETCGDQAETLYDRIFDEVVRVDSATEAELVKLVENTFRAVNIGLVNELAQVSHELEVDIWNAIDAAKTKPFGFMPFYPGPGLGGHCIPIDPFYLSWKANEHGIDTRFINLAETVNREMPDHVVRRVVEQLNNRGKSMSEVDILVVGAAYKPDVSDVRESPAIDIIAKLEEWNVSVDYHDPHVPALEIGETTYSSVPLTDDRLEQSDCVLIVTDHSVVDVDEIIEKAPLVFDSRNASSGTNSSNVVRL